MGYFRGHEPPRPGVGTLVSTVVVTTFFAILVLVTMLGVLGVVAFALMDRLRIVPGIMGAIGEMIRPIVLWLAFGIALTATAGSLYLSEVAGFIPCVLCWYQRIAMYPLVVLLGIAAVRGDLAIRRYAVAIAGIGSALSIWHIAVQRLPGVPSGSCSLTAPCDLIYIERFGFITIPVMALAGFLAIIALLVAFARPSTDPHPDLDPDPEPEQESPA
jgi:disulfide bond formation protein DsbB